MNSIETIKKLDQDINALLGHEDLKWCQHAKKTWYQLGDKNTKCFHMCATQRKQRNIIVAITNDQGQSISNQVEIEEVFHSYFHNLFKSSLPSRDQINLWLSSVNKCFTPDMNDHLQTQFTSDKVQVALKQMAPLKSLDPNGFSACFFSSILVNCRSWSL